MEQTITSTYLADCQQEIYKKQENDLQDLESNLNKVWLLAKLPTEKLAYLAGYFEGEGSIWFDNRKSPMLYISLTTGDEEVLKEFAVIFGGEVKPVKAYKRKAKRVIFSWEQSGSKAQETLRQLSPFFRIKQTLAFLALTPIFLERGTKVTPFETELRQRVADQVSKINNRITVA